MNRALLVGIRHYKDPGRELPGSENDVDGMRQLLLRRCAFSNRQIVVLKSARATRAAIRRELKSMVTQARPGDRLLFQFCGHGDQVRTPAEATEPDQLDEAICPFEYNWNLADRARHAVIDDELHRLFRQLPDAARFIWISDSCHSGDLSDTNRKSFAGVARQFPVALLTACRENQRAADFDFADGAHGLFSYYLLRELQQANAPTRSLANVLARVRQKIKKARFAQEPQSEGDAARLRQPFFFV
jgi:uncharacterized caspase-like protein